MATSSGLPLSGYLLRRYTATDQEQVMALIGADQRQGDLVTSPALADALAGRVRGDAHWRAQLTHVRVDVLVTTAGSGADVVGVISYGRWCGGLAGVVLWMHAREQPVPVRILMQHAINELQDCPHLYSCDLATAVAPEVRPAPCGHRPITTAELRALGFADTDRCRYLGVQFNANSATPTEPPPEVTLVHPTSSDTSSWTVTAHRRGHIVGQATLCGVVDNVGELWWWLGADDSPHDPIVGRALLGAALDPLRTAGATDIVLRVSGPQRRGRDHEPVESLYRTLGFIDVDQLDYHSRLSRDSKNCAPELHLSRPRDQPMRAPQVTSDKGGVPLADMLTVVETDGQKTFMVDTDSFPTELAPEVLNILCDALETIRKREPSTPSVP